MTLEHILIITATSLDLLCIVAVVFFERKNPTSTIAWVLVLVFMPFLGFIAYLVFGGGFRVNKKKRFILKASRDAHYDNNLVNYLKTVAWNSVGGLGDEGQSTCGTNIVSYLQNEGDASYSKNNAVRIFTDGNHMFASLLEDIRQAKKHINMLFYIIKNDQIGQEVLAALEQKAREGVRVRVMYDGLGTIVGISKMFEALEKAGGSVAAFSRLFLNLTPRIRVNFRNHRKITIIDGKIGYIGGMNLGDEYLGRDKKLFPWRDTHLRVTGSAVWFLQERFFMDWLHVKKDDPESNQLEKYFPPPLETGDIAMQIASSGPDSADRTPIKSGFLKMIYSACQRVYIQTPYFIPDDSLIDALRIAAQAGVDVRLMIPRLSDHPLVHPASLGYAQLVQEHGVKVYLYNGFLHAKSIICDDRIVSIGSSNFDIRSFSLNFEVNAFLYSREFARKNLEIFEHDITNSQLLNKQWFEQKSIIYKGFCKIARLFAPLM